MTPAVVCVLGVHRSGTSLTGRLLNLLGVHMGPDARVVSAGQDNPTGFWEYRPFVEISDEILSRFGGRWDAPPTFPPSWQHDSRLDDLRTRVRELVEEDFAAASIWGWKDPRTCLTLPFFRDLIGPMRYVIAMRNPCAVMASLVRRDGMSPDQAERLWLGHVRGILAHASGWPRMFICYEDLLDDWSRELQRLQAFIGAPQVADTVLEAAGGFVDPSLCHHRMSIDDLAGDRRLSYATKSLYLALKAHAAGAPVAADAAPVPPSSLESHRALDLLGTQALTAWDRSVALAAERDQLLRRIETQTTSSREGADDARMSSEAPLAKSRRTMSSLFLTMSDRRRARRDGEPV